MSDEDRKLVRERANAVRRACLEHATDLLASADAAIGAPIAAHNVAYHLAILALEEIGKAGMVSARAATQGLRDNIRLEKRFDDHAWKLMWAVWTPSMDGGRIDPKDFEAARVFAQSTHERRLRGLYVDPNSEEAGVAPKEAVSLGQATSVLELARSRLEYERAVGDKDFSEGNPDLEWFLNTLNDERGARLLFSPPFIAKHEELKGDTRAWVEWARSEHEKLVADEHAHLERELARLPAAEGDRPKWVIKARLHTRSHSIRAKPLVVWNDAIERIKLIYTQKPDELLVEITLADTVKVEEVFDVGLSYLKVILVAINVGSLGLFWHQFPEHVDRYYESIRDLDAPEMSLEVSKENPYAGWRREALNEERIRRILECLTLLAPISNDDAAPIFSPYLRGLLRLCKSDLYLSMEKDAQTDFSESLKAGCKFFGDWDGESDLVATLHAAFEKIIPDEENRNTMFAPLRANYTPQEGRFAEALNMKRLTDLYFVMVASRNWRALASKAPAEDAPPPSPGSSASDSSRT